MKCHQNKVKESKICATISAIIQKIFQFVTVGVLELLDDSLSVLECKLPRYFKVNSNGFSFFKNFIHSGHWSFTSDQETSSKQEY